MVNLHKAMAMNRRQRLHRFTSIPCHYRLYIARLHTYAYSLSPPTTIIMSFWSRKEKNLIPPVQSEQSSRDELLGRRGVSPGPPSNSSSPRPSAHTYAPSRDGGSPSDAAPPTTRSFSDRYARQNAVGDVYSRGKGDLNQDRSELFSGYNPEKAGSGRFFNDGPAAGREPPPGEEGEEDIEGIKQQIRSTKQDSVMSTRNALRLAREAEETALGTVGKLGSQSGEMSRVYAIGGDTDNLCREIGEHRTLP